MCWDAFSVLYIYEIGMFMDVGFSFVCIYEVGMFMGVVLFLYVYMK